MKSAHRHQLETNALAQRLDVLIERSRPYAATVAGVAVALAVIVLIWSYVSGSSAARQSAAWDAYNQSIAAVPPDLEQLRRSAEEYPNTRMQQLANITWADGQVWIASRDYIHNRESANEALRRATSAYQAMLQTTDNERLVNRAHLGLARVYEMQNDLERARQAYLQIKGGYEDFAKQQAERLAEASTKEEYAWLATAEAPRSRAPRGPGVPGARPEFSAGDFPLPGEGSDPATSGEPDGQTFEDLLKSFDLGFPKEGEADRYDPSADMPAGEDATPGEDAEAPSGDTPVEAAPVEDAPVEEDATADVEETEKSATEQQPAE